MLDWIAMIGFNCAMDDQHSNRVRHAAGNMAFYRSLSDAVPPRRLVTFQGQREAREMASRDAKIAFRDLRNCLLIAETKANEYVDIVRVVIDGDDFALMTACANGRASFGIERVHNRLWLVKDGRRGQAMAFPAKKAVHVGRMSMQLELFIERCRGNRLT